MSWCGQGWTHLCWRVNLSRRGPGSQFNCLLTINLNNRWKSEYQSCFGCGCGSGRAPARHNQWQAGWRRTLDTNCAHGYTTLSSIRDTEVLINGGRSKVQRLGVYGLQRLLPTSASHKDRDTRSIIHWPSGVIGCASKPWRASYWGMHPCCLFSLFFFKKKHVKKAIFKTDPIPPLWLII